MEAHRERGESTIRQLGDNAKASDEQLAGRVDKETEKRRKEGDSEMDELDTTTRITRSYPTSLGDVRDDLKKQILLNHTGSRLAYNQIPLVHGRSVGARLDAASTNGGASTGANNGKGCGGGGAGRTAAGGRTRMASHQRNLSLDFRSMGIVLPPVSQVTNTRVNLTQHHRNRSLDSALQGIPEVSVFPFNPNHSE